VPDTLTVRQALAQCGLAPVDANALLAHVLGKDRTWLVAHATDPLLQKKIDEFFAAAKRRRDGQPVAYLTGTREFYSLALQVTPDVLIPRPETETLVEAALAYVAKDAAARILDLGTGTGAIALAIARVRPRAEVMAIDVSDAALAVAATNAQRLGIGNVRFTQSNWYASLGETRFDFIVSNPPYIAADDPHLREGDLRFEPRAALTPGGDGLDALRAIIAGAPDHFADSAMLLVEHGYDQADAVHALFVQHGFVDIKRWRDLAGHWRVAGGSLSPGAHGC
jgi:release factor glutamine methyltransferase